MSHRGKGYRRARPPPRFKEYKAQLNATQGILCPDCRQFKLRSHGCDPVC
ncbi:unnamed protein product [Penicillium roqueforti FM164]|uniref:Genomic scaffold, ProqFM164S04 n=1 Tax=Penicillium roqueforti (strain FM164) TaxID=1365484 RepID=W6QIE0_PENRF|nr:unnamed protein product [Penicillium roqueforti FM164]